MLLDRHTQVCSVQERFRSAYKMNLDNEFFDRKERQTFALFKRNSAENSRGTKKTLKPPLLTFLDFQSFSIFDYNGGVTDLICLKPKLI